MTDPAPQTSDPVNARRVIRRRRALWLLVGLALCGLTGYWFYLRVTERSRVVAAITAAGGKFHEAPASQRFARSLSRLFGKNAQGSDEVFLDGPGFDDAWLAAQHDLRSLEIRELLIRNTEMTREAVLRLLQRHDLETFTAPGMSITDDNAQQLGIQEHLIFLNVMQSDLTDTGFAALKPARLQFLYIAGTHVTADSLQRELSTNWTLQSLALDGRQFTPELAAQLAQMRSLTMMVLIGRDVTDAHVKLLESMPNIRYIRLEQTSVSEEAVAALRAARPQPGAVDVPGPEDIFYRWRPE